MNRDQAQEQLAAVAREIRERGSLTPDRFPVLSLGVQSGGVLWQLSSALATTEGWAEEQMANWYEHRAINHLILTDE